MELDTGRIIGVLTLATVFYLILNGRQIFRALRRRTEASRLRREPEEIVREAADDRPPMSASDADDFKEWLAANALPYTGFTIAGEPAASPVASRIGGRPLLPPGRTWPLDLHGNSMVFLAQINFAEVPPLPDFPDSGLLLFFIATDDYFGMNAHHEGDDVRIIYVADFSTAALADQPLRTGQTPFRIPQAQTEGRAIAFVPVAQMTPWGDDWRIDDKWPGWWARSGDTNFAGLVDEASEQVVPDAYIGGTPCVVGGDPRAEPGWSGYDRVLLRIGSDEPLMWGDAGAACFFIRRADLLARNFSRVRFSWDQY